MSENKTIEDIDAWQLARELTRKVYGLTKKTKFARDFGSKQQIHPCIILRKITLKQ